MKEQEKLQAKIFSSLRTCESTSSERSSKNKSDKNEHKDKHKSEDKKPKDSKKEKDHQNVLLNYKELKSEMK